MKIKWSLNQLILCIALFCLWVPAQADLSEIARKKSQLAFQSDGWIEGFNRSLSGEWINYNNIRSDVNRALLTRTTTGSKTISWESAPVPSDLDTEMVTFLWIAGMDLNRGPFEFTLYINDIPRFIFSNLPDTEWTIPGIANGTLSFLNLKKDQHGDGFGYMWMTIPGSWCKAGEALEIKVVGSAMNSTAWFMTFEAPDALAYLQNEARYEGWITLMPHERNGAITIDIQASPNWSGQTMQFKSGEHILGVGKLDAENNMAGGKIDMDASLLETNPSLSMFLGDQFITSFPGFFMPVSETQLRTMTVAMTKSGTDNEGQWQLKTSLFYRPNLIRKLQAVSQNIPADGLIYLMNSSHQDIAWMDSPEKCIIERDTMLLTPLIERALRDDAYRFDIEDALMLIEYLQRHPEKKSSVHQLLLDGKISVGASYSMPYEDMYSGESLIRQFYLGKRWIEKEFPGYTTNTYWNVDVPGRTLQMPQIMKKSGVPNIVLSRQKSGVYNWYSPDGSFITVFSPGHYSLAFPALNRDFFDAAYFLADYSLQWEHVRDPNGKAAIPLLSDWDMSPAKDYSSLIGEWESMDAYYGDDGEKTKLELPKFQLSLTGDYFNRVDLTKLSDPIQGERPDVWLYIHGPSHQKALKASREADRLLPLAETFATFESLLNGHFKNYPETEINRAWSQKIYPDHGWGGKHGDITDALFLSQYEKALETSRQVLNQSLQSIAARVRTQDKMGMPFMVFNGLSWIRSDPHTVTFRFEPGETRSLVILDDAGKEVPFQVNGVTTFQDDSWKSVEIEFIAEQIPSLGYRTFYLQSSDEVEKNEDHVVIAASIDNQFYMIETGPGGLKQIYDKELGVSILRNTHYNGGEVITMTSVGNGAGEFADIQQPDPSDMDQTGNYNTTWTIERDGPVYTSVSYKQPIHHAVVKQTIKIYKDIKRLDFETVLLNWDGTLYREFRETFPLNMDVPEVSYEVPFGVVTVGQDEIQEAAGERYMTPCKDIHPRSILNWISASDDRFGVTVSSSVVAWDYQDLKDPDGPKNTLQAILLASRRSCHGEGNEYLQTGRHDFRFSLTSHQPGWEHGYKQGIQANNPLMSIVNPVPFGNAPLPESMSFINVKNENIMISTIKKSESDDGYIIRWYESVGDDCETMVKSYFPISKMEHTNLIEESLSTMGHDPFSFKMLTSGHGIETVKIIPLKNE